MNERPDTVWIDTPADAPEEGVFAALANAVTVVREGDAVDLADVDLAFVSGDALASDALNGVKQVVVLYDEANPANNVANITLIGDALGERVAALEAAAVYTDQLELEAAGS